MSRTAGAAAPTPASDLADELDDLRVEVRRLLLERGADQRTIRDLSAAVAARDEFIAIVGHELRNPMGAIVVSASNMIYKAGREQDLPAWLMPRLLTLERQARSFARRATTLLDIKHLATGSFHVARDVVSLSDVVSEVVRDLAAEAERAGCELRLSIEAGVTGTWDRGALEQITMNLMSNAIRYGAGRAVETSVTSTGEHATIEVRDHGEGDLQVDRSRIFGVRAGAVVARLGPRSRVGITRQLLVAHRGNRRGEPAGCRFGLTASLRGRYTSLTMAHPEFVPHLPDYERHPGLDRVLNGFFASGVYIVEGPGGREDDSRQPDLLHRAKEGQRVLYVTLLAESHARLLQHLQDMSFFDSAVIPERLTYVSGFRVLEEGGLRALLDLLRKELRAQNANLVILDGFAAVGESAETDRELTREA
jgi:anti-sigma regulatory factor (Ser/Thr protein kinase)